VDTGVHSASILELSNSKPPGKARFALTLAHNRMLDIRKIIVESSRNIDRNIGLFPTCTRDTKSTGAILKTFGHCWDLRIQVEIYYYTKITLRFQFFMRTASDEISVAWTTELASRRLSMLMQSLSAAPPDKFN
jgi:hypothetical protein